MEETSDLYEREDAKVQRCVSVRISERKRGGFCISVRIKAGRV